MISLVPRSFLYFLPLHVGAEVIIAIGIFNKASGFYGILSIFTGHPISALEWLLNLISLALLPIYVMAFLNISLKNGLRTLLFAYLYCLDTLLSVIFTILFSVRWFSENSTGGNAINSLQSIAESEIVTNTISSVIDAAADVTSAAIDSDIVSTVTSIEPTATTISEIISSTAEAISSTISDIIDATPAPSAVVDDYVYLAKRAAADVHIVNKSASLAQETSETIIITVALLMVRLYFTLVIIGYARMLVRQQNLRSHNGQPKGSWAAKFQHLAISIAEPFWTGNPSTNTFRLNSPSDIKDDELTLHLNTDFNNDDE